MAGASSGKSVGDYPLQSWHSLMAIRILHGVEWVTDNTCSALLRCNMDFTSAFRFDLSQSELFLIHATPLSHTLVGRSAHCGLLAATACLRNCLISGSNRTGVNGVSSTMHRNIFRLYCVRHHCHICMNNRIPLAQLLCYILCIEAELAICISSSRL